jgi:hypothetical protein
VADDEVGVEPERLAELASALENLRDVLAHNVPVIVNTLEQYWNGGTGTPIDLSPLKQAQARSPEDASEMRSRSNLAQAWMNQAVNIDVVSGGMAYIPWDKTSVDTADAQLQAQQLAAAEQSGNLAQVKAIQTDIQDHIDSNDKAWLQAFYNQAAPQVANLAQTLHDLGAGNTAQDYQNRFTVLTQADQQIMSTYANGLAIADKAGLSPQAVQAITTAPNIWSAAMLIKFGPPGSQWATSEPKSTENPSQDSLLALLTQQVYQDEQNGTIKIPVGYGSGYTAQDRNQLGDTLNSYDPLQAMLQADAQNKNASWQVMGGKDGNAIAKMLLDHVGTDLPGLDGRFLQGQPNSKGQFPGYFTMYAPGKAVPNNQMGQILLNSPSQSVVGAFLDAATSGPHGSGPDARLSAQAAVNIIQNTMAGDTSSGTVQPSYDPAVLQALTNTFIRYLPDLAASSSPPTPPDNTVYANQYAPGHPYEISINSSTLGTFLQELSSTPQNYGYLKGLVANKVGVAYGMQLNGLTDGTHDDPADEFASLYGRFVTEQANLGYSAGQIKDANNAELNSLISFGESEVGSIPIVGPTASKLLSYDQKYAFLGVPQIPQFSTNNAANAAQQGLQNFKTAELQGMIPLMQGLIQQKLVTPDPSWYQSGQVVCNQAFYEWWQANQNLQFQDKTLRDHTPTLHELYTQITQDMKMQQDIYSQTGS